MIVKLTEEQIREYFDSIDKELLERQYVDYSEIYHTPTYYNPLTLLYMQRIDEGMFSTYPLEKTYEYIKNYFGFDDSQIKIIKGYNNLDRFLLYVPNISNNIEIVKKNMGLCGYFLAKPKENEIKDGEWVYLQFEPFIQNDISRELRNEEKNLYHLTPFYNFGKIKHLGFSPRSKNMFFDYPGRVYFMRGSVDKKEIISIGNALSFINTSKGNDGRYVLLTVDLDKVPNDTPFFYDPNYPNGVYTTVNVRPDVIIEKEEFKLKTK